MGLPVLFVTLAVLQVGHVFGNNNIPVFDDYTALDSRYLDEDFKVGDIVGTIQAHDPDNTQVKYFINGDGGEYFSIGRTDGVVRLKKVLEFDTKPSEREIVMTIRVEDEDQQFNQVDGKVYIQDANDLRPEFAKYDIFETLDEDSKPGTFIANISVTDRDTKNDILQVTCIGINDAFADACDKFSLHFVPSDVSNKNWKGELRLAKSLDYESRISYAILLNAFDGVWDRTNEIHIEVRDINDSPPTWTRIRPVTIAEENQMGKPITQVTAEDGDETDPRDIAYEIIPQVYADGAEFSINNETGFITNRARLDYDNLLHNKGQPYEITVKAREVIKTGTGFVLGNDAITTSETVISIAIHDIDDNTPTFNKKEYTAFIPENIATAGNIPGLQMTITDIDSGTFNSFDLVELDWQDIFAIIPENGQANAGATIFIKDSEKIDYERGPREYVINLEARENQAIPPLTGSAIVTIKVTDVNDETPRFDQETYYETIPETAPADRLVKDLDAVDDEAGDLGTAGIRYKLFGNQGNHFKIDAITGAITVADCATPGYKPCIDYESKKQYVLTVSATDMLGSQEKGRTRSVQVIVSIEDENDNVPAPDAVKTAYIYEEQTEPVLPLVIRAEDPDTVGGPVTYELSGPAAVIANWQIIQSDDENGDRIGTITARRPVLFSDAQDLQTGRLQFQVLSSDQKSTVTTDVNIFILDINNNAPKFSQDEYVENIKEDTLGEVSVITVTVTDGDAPTTGNGIVDLSISSGSLGKFTVKSKTKVGDEYHAEIFTTPDAAFNYDLNNKYTMTIVARDQGTPESKRGEATLIVNIIDINNNVPQITPTSVSITVAENRAINSNVHEVLALDPDKTADLRYYMFPNRAQNPSGVTVDENDYNYKELFRIEENTGIVRVNKGLNREQTSFLVSRLEVVDIAASPRQTGTGVLVITITEVNDQDPIFDLPLYNLTIDEEPNINSFVRNLHCKDEDDQIARYIIQQTSPRIPNFFTLMDNTGVLTVSNRIDFEALEQITLTATCYDDGVPQRSGTTDIVVTILNINDNSPQFEKPLYTATLFENDAGEDLGGTFLVEVSATDIDKGDFGVVRYKMADTSIPFEIDELSGKITVKAGAVFDREIGSSLGFQVIAYDSPNTPSKRKETTVPVYLSILDINDNCPIFDSNIYTGSIPESAKTGTDIIDVIATDKDFGKNRLIQFSVQPGSFDPPEGESYFDIGQRSGRVYTRSTLTGKSGLYRFNVTATDTEGKDLAVMCSTHVPVEATVSQSQNYAPRFVDPPQRDWVIYVLESQYEGMLVYDSKAEDFDPGRSGVIDYFFVVGSDHVAATEEFRINQVTGIIRAEIEFDREQVDKYFLTLVAKDQGATRASSETTLIVVILDVDDNDPIFEMKNGKVEPLVLPEYELKEDVTPLADGLKVGQCHATDADSDHKNNQIFYEIITADDIVKDLVRINEDTCEIYLTKAVDYEITPALEFSIFAYNKKNDDKVKRHKREVNPSILPVVIRITDVNDIEPAFDEKEYFACTPLESPYRTSILDLDAHDPEQDDTELQFSLINTPDFEIDQQGIIHNLISFPSTSRRVFSFDAQVSDGKHTSTSRVNIFVTSDSTQVVMKINRPASDIRRVSEEYEELLMDSSPQIKYACADVKNHIRDDGTISSSQADIYLAVVGWDAPNQGYTIWSGSRLHSYLDDDRSSRKHIYDSMFISSISEVEDDDFALDEDVVLAILIVAILLIVIAIILFILACYCIWAKKKRKVRKVKAQRHTIVQSTVETKGESFENPVYHNSGYVAYEDEYSTVGRSRKEAGPIAPVVIPAPENLQPLTTFQPENLEPQELQEEATPPELPEPFIETEVMPEDEPESPAPVSHFMEPEYEDRIETEVMEGDNADDVHDEDELPLPDPPVDEDEIETEIRDDTPPPTPEATD